MQHRWLERFSLRTAVSSLAGLGLASLVLVFLLTWLPLRAVQVNGPIYTDIVADKDLVADVLPPPLYLVRPYLLTVQLAQQYDAAKRAELLRGLAEAREAFEARHAHWRAAERDAEAAAALDRSRTHALAFLEAAAELGRAMDDGDAMRALAALERARTEFEAHGAENEKLVALVAARATARERAADGLVAARLSLVLLLLALAAVAVGGAAWMVARSITREIEALRGTVVGVATGVAAGRIDVRCDAAALHPDLRPVAAGVNRAMDAFERPVRLTAEVATRLSRGDVPEPITEPFEGDFNVAKDALNRCIAAVNALVSDAGDLARAGVEGRLSARADASRHEGDFRRIVQGVNDTLDAVVGPLGVAARCVDEIAKGRIPPPIEGTYRGDFEALKANLNACIAALGGVLEQTLAVTRAQDEGDVEAFIAEDRFVGVYRELAAGVNAGIRTHVTAILKFLDLVKAYAEGDFSPTLERLKGKQVIANERFDLLRENLRAVAAEIVTLSEAAAAGRLSVRADASRFRGDWKALAAGVNGTLDAVIAPVTEAATVLDRLAERDLRARMTGSYRGDHARIQRAVNAAAEALHASITQVAAAVDQVSSAATQIASSSQAVAAGASEQASSLEETSASIDSVSGMTRASADHAHQAHLLVQGTREAATAGAAAVEQMQGAMSRIKASSEGTSQIIKDVSEIAFQTNLLALNAAVEAARAGEAGRGFAVVAEEVRSLALRAKEAATKTEALIRQSVKEANEGERSAGHVAGKLEEIAGGVGKVTAIVSEIAAAAKEQSAGIGQVSKAVAEMDKVTQQNAASAEESSSAASELSGQAEELAAMVASFQLDRDAGALTTGRRAPALPRPAARALPAHATAPRAAPPGPARNGKAAHAEELFPMQDGELKDF